MTGKTKALYAILAFLLIVVGVYFMMKGSDNCWSHYQTENAAILNCEVHP